MVRAIISSTDSTSVTPDVECPALQISFQRFGRSSRAPMSMSLPMSMAPRAGRSSGSRPAASIEGRSMLVCNPVKAVVSRISSALLATSMSLYRISAMLSRVAVADATGKHQWTIKERPYRAHEHERIEPTGLAARARRQQHQPVGAGGHRALGVTDRGDVGEHGRAGIVQ